VGILAAERAGQCPVTRHEPREPRTNTVTVECAATGPEALSYGGNPYRLYTLADVEAWCAELRRLGARDDLALPHAEGLRVTLEAADRR
jgi:hypothetical protein